MKIAQDYPVTFKYGATTAPYSPSKPHKGADRACPAGTPIVIAEVTIGLTGRSGKATGPHLHTQAGTDKACQNTFDPKSVEFKPGLVVFTRSVDTGDWGKCITMLTSGGYVTYAHLSQVNVKTGDIIKAKEDINMPSLVKDNMDVARMMMVGILGRNPYDVHVLHKDDEYLNGKKDYPLEKLARELHSSEEGKRFEKAMQESKVLEPGKYVVK